MQPNPKDLIEGYLFFKGLSNILRIWLLDSYFSHRTWHFKLQGSGSKAYTIWTRDTTNLEIVGHEETVI